MEQAGKRRRKTTILLLVSITDAMKVQAEAHNRSLSRETEWALQEYLNRQQQTDQQTERATG